MMARLEAKEADEVEVMAVEEKLKMVAAAVRKGLETEAERESSCLVIVFFFFMMLFIFFLLLHLVIPAFKLRESDDGMLEKLGR